MKRQELSSFIQFTNSEEFKLYWSLFITGITSEARENNTVLSLEAYYESFEVGDEEKKLSWKIACDGLWGTNFSPGYMRPFYQISMVKDHPIIWSSISETYFYINSPIVDIALLLGDLLLVHADICGNWINFDRIFGFLPKLIQEKSKVLLVAPTRLIEHYSKVFRQHKIEYSIKTTKTGRTDLSLLLFSSGDFPDSYNYGQPYIIARKFELI